MINWFRIQKFWHRVSLHLRRNIIKKLGLRLGDNYFLDNPHAGQRNDVDRIDIYAKAQNITMPDLVHKEDLITFSFPRRYIYEIPNAIIDPVTGLVYDQDGKLIAESSAWDYQRLLADVPRPRISSPTRTLKGRYLFFPTTSNLYHWLIEDLPPFLGAYQQVPDARVLIGAYNFSVIDEFIESYIPDDAIRCQAPIRVEKLIMAGKNAGLGSPFPPHNTPHPHDLVVLREWFSEYLSDIQDQNNDNIMIYVSRTRARRGIEGEALLESALEDLGFTIFHGDLSLVDEIRLFSKASFVLGMQGAGMTNIVWLPPKSKVLQLHFPKASYRFFFNMGCMLDLDYQFFEVPKERWTESDIDHIVSKVKEFI